jgi:HAD superfamily hydrolase (TIGR01509 family)
MSLPRRVAAVVFDMDGLLIDSEVLVRAGVRRAASALGFDFPDALYARTIGQSDVGYVAAVRDHFGDGFPMERFLEAEKVEIAREFAAGVALKDGVIELVDHLDRLGLPYAVATSSGRASAQKHLGEHGLYDRFRTIVAREDVARHKPDPAPYLEAARRLGVEPTLCRALEDSHNGVRAAASAGMMTVMAPDLLDPTEEMRTLCVHIVDSLHAVRRLLDTAAL